VLTPSGVGSAGEKHATDWLRANGWRCFNNTRLPGATDIEANSGIRSILVQVKTAVLPDRPAGLSVEERKAIVARATRNGKEAWLAQLQVNRQGELVGRITWTELT
jgi:Holliday junction resolvase-like predicted endonuclease